MILPLKCVVIDDEPLARECIAGYIAEVDFMDLAGVGSNPLELTQLLDAQNVDLIFLDIQMPIMNGIEFLKVAKDPPMVIVTTAYPIYALESFQLDVMDYLLKPVTFNRFFQAATKAKDYQELLMMKSGVATEAVAGEGSDYFFIKCNHRYERIYKADILYVEAMQNYVTIVTAKGKYTTLLNLKSVEQNLDEKLFIRVHKSYVVSIPKIEAIDNNEILIQSFRIPISRQHREHVLERVVNDKLWKR